MIYEHYTHCKIFYTNSSYTVSDCSRISHVKDNLHYSRHAIYKLQSNSTLIRYNPLSTFHRGQKPTIVHSRQSL